VRGVELGRAGARPYRKSHPNPSRAFVEQVSLRARQPRRPFRVRILTKLDGGAVENQRHHSRGPKLRVEWQASLTLLLLAVSQERTRYFFYSFLS
jgi:hypothetical protein